MVILIYFLISLVGGLIPAFLAKKMEKNFILWWIYGAVFLPIALVHVVLLMLKIEKGILAVRILLIVYGIVTFYFVTWAMSTQPIAMKWLAKGEDKYALGKVMYEDADKITSLISNVTDYFVAKTDYDPLLINSIFSGMDSIIIESQAKVLPEGDGQRLIENGAFDELVRIQIDRIADLEKESEKNAEEVRIRKALIDMFQKEKNAIETYNFVSVYDYLENATEVKRIVIDDELAYFEPKKHRDKEYVQTFGLELIQSIENVYKVTIEKGAFEEWSVPMGEAKNVFSLYLKSLTDLTIYLKDSPSAVEKNYMAYLKTESTYLGKTTIVDEYLIHLDKEVAKNPDDERKLALIKHYAYIGDRLVHTKQLDISLKSYDRAIALYREIIQQEGKSAKEKVEDLFYIGELYDKKGEFESVVTVFKEFLYEYFNGKLFLDEDAIYDLEAYIMLKIIIKDTKSLNTIIKEFADFIDNFTTQEKEQVCKVENRILEIFFPKLPKAERAMYIPILKDNYDYLISPKNLDVFPIIKEAYNFFENFKFYDVAQSYIEMLDDIEPIVFAAVDEVKDNVSIGLLADVAEAMEYVEGIFLKSLILTDTMSGEIKTLQERIRENSKTAIDTIIKIRDIMADMEELMSYMERNKELKDTLQTQIENKKKEMSEIQNAISKATKNYNDVVKDILRENEIRTKEYDAVLAMITEAQELGDSLGLVPPGQRKTKMAEMLRLRAEIKNEVSSLSTIIDNIVTAKQEIAKKYAETPDTLQQHKFFPFIIIYLAKKYAETPDTLQLLEIKEKLITLKDEIDVVVEKYFPGELAKADEK